MKQASKFLKVDDSNEDHDHSGGMFGGTSMKRRKELLKLGVAELKELIKSSSSSSSTVDFAAMMALAAKLAAEALERPKGKRTELLTSAALLMEHCLLKGGGAARITESDEATLAKVHCEIWLGRGVNAEIHNLRRALYLFQKCANSKTESFKDDVVFWNEYVRVLQLTGNNETAALTMKEILTNFPGSEAYPTYLFATGAIYKALGQHEIASDYLFEATQIGPPKLFSKLDMMFIISRNIEESNKNKDDDGADAYEMVHEHLVIDGILPAEVTYHDWISNSDTWRTLADKCQIVGLFPLATDLYGQALLRDQLAYMKSKLWFGFAKACAKSGRSSEAQLAIKQALTIDPFNSQLISTRKAWSEDRPSFEAIVDNLHAIIDGLPEVKDKHALRATCLQAAAKGQLTRVQLFVGQGSREELRRRMSAQVGVIAARTRPLLITANADWIGRIKHLVVFDVKSDTKSKLKLSAPFTPAKEIGLPRRLCLSLHTHIKKVTRGAGCGAYSMGSYRLASEEVDQTVIAIRFTDEETNEYMEKRFVLKHPEMDAPDNLAAASHLSDDSLASGNFHFKEAPEGIPPLTRDHQSFVDTIGLEDEPSGSIYTDIVGSDLARAGFARDGKMFLLRLRNDGALSKVTLLRVSQMTSVEIVLPREYFDRSVSMKKHFKFVIEIIIKVPALAELLLDAKPNQSSGVSEGRLGVRVGDKLVLVSFKKTATGATVELISPGAGAIIGVSAEVLSKTPEKAERERHVQSAQIDIPTKKSSPRRSPKFRTESHKEVAEKPSDFNNFLKFVSQSGKDSPASKKASFDEKNLAERSPHLTPPHRSQAAFIPDDALTLGSSLDDDSVKGVDAIPSALAILPSSPPIGSRSPSMTMRKGTSIQNKDLAGASVDDDSPPAKKRGARSLKALSSGGGEGEDPVDEGDDDNEEEEEDDTFERIEGEGDDPETRRSRRASKKSKAVDDSPQSPEGAGRKMSVIKDQYDSSREAKKKAVKEQRLREKHLREEKVKEKEKERKKKEEAAEKGVKYNRSTIVDFSKMKKFAKKAPKTAVNFLEHQHSRMVATDYLRERAVKAIFVVHKEEAAAYLIERAAAAMRQYNADIAKFEAKSASASASSALKDSIKRGATQSFGKAESRKNQPQKSGKVGLGKAAVRNSRERDDTTKSFTSPDAALTKIEAADGDDKPITAQSATEQSAVDSQSATKDEAAATSTPGSRPPSRTGDTAPAPEGTESGKMVLGKSLSQMLNEMLNEVDESKSTTASLSIENAAAATAAVAPASSEDPATVAEEISLAVKLTLTPPIPEGLSKQLLTVDTCSDLVAADSTAALDAGAAALSPSVVISPTSGRPRPKKVFSPYKNAAEELSAKSSHKHLRRPLNLSDIPSDAYCTPETLVLALRALSQGAAEAEAVAPQQPGNNRFFFEGGQLSDEPLGPADSSVTSKYSMDIDRNSIASNRSKKKKDAKAFLRKMIGIQQSIDGASLASPISTRPSTRARNELLDFQQQRILQPRVLPLNKDQTSSLFAPLQLTESSVTKLLRPLKFNANSDPVGFMAPEAFTVTTHQPPLYMKSIEQFQKKGYNDGNDMYVSMWRTKIQGCLARFTSKGALKKVISNLQKVAHMPITRMEAFCVVADSNGSVNESLGKLLNAEYFREIRLVCALLPIESVIEAIVDGKAKRKGPWGLLGQGVDSMYTLAGDSAAERTALVRKFEIESLQHDIAMATSLSENSRLSPEALIRMHGVEASTKLSHMNLKGHSPAIVKRGHVVMSPDRSGNKARLPPNSSMDFDFESMGIDPFMDPRATFQSQESSLTTKTSASNSSRILRVDKTMDDYIQEEAPMVIMSRKQALMAREDEFLSRSDKPQFQRMSSNYKVEKKRSLKVDTDISQTL